MYGFERPSPILAHAQMVHKAYKETHDQWDKRFDDARVNEAHYRGGKESMERFLRTYNVV
jgi:hypothetical protein